MGSSTITPRAASASGSRVPVSPQSRLYGGIGSGSGPRSSRQTPRTSPRQSHPTPLTLAWSW